MTSDEGKDSVGNTSVAGCPNADTIYQQASENWRTFLEWRHRIILRLFVVLAGFVLVGKWLVVGGQKQFLCIPTALMSLLFLVAFLLDRRNAVVLRATRSVLAQLEARCQYQNGFYTAYPQSGWKSPSYARVLCVTYLCGCIESLIAAVALLASSAGESHPHALSEPGVNLSAHRAPIIQPSV